MLMIYEINECSCVEIFPRCFLPIARVDCRAIAIYVYIPCIAQSVLASPFPPLKFAACSIAIHYIFILSCQDHTYLGTITEERDCEILPRSSLSLNFLVEMNSYFLLMVT